MAITLTEANKHSTNKVVKGVMEEIINESVVLQKTPFTETNGIAIQYVRETDLGGGATFIDPDEEIPEQTGSTTQVTVGLKILATHADVPEFVARTRSNYYDFVAEIMEMKAKDVKYTVVDKLFYGSSATNSKEFDGLHTLVDTDMQLHAGSGSTPGALTTRLLDEALDLMRGGDPDCAITTRRIRRRLNHYLRANGSYQTERDDYGKITSIWNNTPIYIDDMLKDTESISSGAFSSKTGGSSSSLFFKKYGPRAIFGIQNSGGLSIRKIANTLESKDVARWRFRWWLAQGLGSTLTLARIDGIDGATAVTSGY